MAEQTLNALGDRMESLAEAIRSHGRVLAVMLGNQKLHNEMLAKVLEAVTSKPADGENGLEKLLAALVRDIGHLGEKLDLIIERIDPAGG